MRNARYLLLSTLAALSSLTLLEGLAEASPEYPRIVEETLKLSCPPKCVLCHQTIPGRAGNASRPFALELKAQGLEGQSPDDLRNLLTALAAEKSAPTASAQGGATGMGGAGTPSSASGPDSDGDGVSDLDELLGTPPTDPNGQTGQICAADLAYGCTTAAPPPQSGFNVLLPFFTVAGAFAAFAFRRIRFTRNRSS